MMIAEGFTCQRYGFNVGADKFSLLTIENGKTSIMRLSEWTLISQSQKSHSDRLLVKKWADRLEQKGRIRRTAIVALARQLMVALWRYVVKGEAIEGAIINKPIEV